MQGKREREREAERETEREKVRKGRRKERLRCKTQNDDESRWSMRGHSKNKEMDGVRQREAQKSI